MGSLCCCPVPDHVEELVSYPNGRLYQRCTCLQGCMHWLLYLYSSLFERFAAPSIASSQTSPPASAVMVTRSSDSSLMDTYRAPPRPLPYDVDTRYVRLPRDGLVSRREKIGMSHLFSANSDSPGGEAMALLPRQSSDSGEQAQDSESVDKQQCSKLMSKSESMLSLIDDEDVCPTCLDVYTPENPKIDTECTHHFHLACILEWLERSSHCPVCDKEMKFNESPGV